MSENRSINPATGQLESLLKIRARVVLQALVKDKRSVSFAFLEAAMPKSASITFTSDTLPPGLTPLTCPWRSIVTASMPLNVLLARLHVFKPISGLTLRFIGRCSGSSTCFQSLLGRHAVAFLIVPSS